MSDNLLDATLDDLADLPETKAFPVGAHAVTMFLNAPQPKPGKKQQVHAKFVYRAPKELANPTDAAPNPGDESMIFLSLYKKDGEKNEFGEGQLKRLLQPLKDGGLSGSNRELIDATKPGVDVVIVNTLREFPAGSGQFQMQIEKIELDN
jgi:hypothetical protein